MPQSKVVVERYLQQCLADLHTAWDDVRRGEDEGVHDTRVACRRIRSTLATTRPLLRDDAVAEEAREALQQHASALAASRDEEVVAEMVRDWTDTRRLDVDPAALLGLGVAAPDQGDPAAVIDGAGDLDRRLGRSLESLPWRRSARRSPARTLGPPVAKSARRVLRRLDAAMAVDDPDVRAAGLHDARKAAKRLRYAAEMVAADLPARRLARVAKALQTDLGLVQDVAVLYEVLARVEDRREALAPRPAVDLPARLRTRAARETAAVDERLPAHREELAGALARWRRRTG